MPELPEVETIRLGLQKYLVGHTIEEIEVRLPKMVSGDVQKVKGATVQGIRRFGKGLVIDLDNQYSIAIHIKMTGQLIYKGPASNAAGAKISEKVGGPLPNSATHVIFKLKSQSANRKAEEDAVLYYNDIRRFGWIRIVKTDDVFSLPFFKDLGPEPLPSSGQAALTLAQFRAIVQRSKGPIKPLLMDQKKIGGIGNIYANDSLFVAGILPSRKASSLSEKETEKLFQAILRVFKKGLSVGGASEWQYVNALGEAGKYQEFFQVYGRVGRPCLVCKTPIKKTVMAGRGTYFCPACQR